GAHTGGILYTRDPSMTDEMEEEIEQQLRDSKGIGNFSTILVNIPGGDGDAIKFIEMGDISAKDEFANIKNISAQDILNAHRFPAGLAGIVPQNTAGLGDVEKAERIYKKSEVAPVQRRFMMAVNNDPEIPENLHLNFDLSYTESTDKGAV
ncbi:phage portal protein, partial [Salmonella enterica subsp. enterica serovar Soerenga]